MAQQPYAWARVEQVDGVAVCRLSDDTLADITQVTVLDLETGQAPIDEDGAPRRIHSASEHHIEFYTGETDGDELSTRHLAGRYSVTAQPLEFD